MSAQYDFQPPSESEAKMKWCPFLSLKMDFYEVSESSLCLATGCMAFNLKEGCMMIRRPILSYKDEK